MLSSQIRRRLCFFIRVYLQSVIDHINGQMETTDLISLMSVFDPCHLLDKEEQVSNYGMEKMRTLINFYSIAQRLQFDVAT